MAPNLSRVSVLLGCLFNVLSGILIVLVNKWIYKHIQFPNITLTCIHFVCTSLGLLICLQLGVFLKKSVPLLSLLPLCVTFCGFVVLTNLSLQFNTVGTYQLLKTLTTPFVILVQWYWFNKKTSFAIKCTVIPICFGVFLNSYSDLKFSWIGVFFGCTGFVVTSVYQVLVGHYQAELQLNSMQLLFYQAPLSALMLAVCIPFLEPLPSVEQFSTWSDVVLIGFSGVLAFLVNLSIFWVIGNTSALTYNMVGHSKFFLVLLGGFLFFPTPVVPLQVLGIAIAISGIIAYSVLKLKESTQPVLPQQVNGK